MRRSSGDCSNTQESGVGGGQERNCYSDPRFPGGPKAEGRAAIREGFAHYLGGFTVKEMQMTELGQQNIDDLRTVWGTYALRAVDKASGVESIERSRFTDVQKKVGGRWLYFVDHPSLDPPAAAPKP